LREFPYLGCSLSILNPESSAFIMDLPQIDRTLIIVASAIVRETQY